jgi:hypothetical protein
MSFCAFVASLRNEFRSRFNLLFRAPLIFLPPAVISAVLCFSLRLWSRVTLIKITCRDNAVFVVCVEKVNNRPRVSEIARELGLTWV